ncbi:plastocyanin/azurin family copper-binding protein [Nitrosarchaeum sp.]|uniref:cupredoxin domain-containing protein n=1 Tax=Nitrosarchaeum sp. TaxID=2026886 RepID=UPI00247D831B|nr:plastocyanin/azurin family copper-binding protein [Nitrosarchaeum sp.]MCV0412189.1 hypothetical protein [Nitrosarchaeum sp.]
MSVFVFIIFDANSISDSYAEEITINIPFGAYSPELNTPAEVWYDPPVVSATVGDTITWINNDKEGHTVTSGQGSGRFGWMNNDFGISDGLFDSDRFMPGESWSYKFEESGTFSYYCTIHPWMDGVITIKESVLDYPHDAFGNKIESFPVIKFTPDNIIEVDLTWEPNVIKTHEKVQFIYQFYSRATNANLAKMQYDFVLIQNGKEIYRDTGLTQIGGDYRNFVFDNTGSIIIRFEGIEGTAGTISDKTIDVTTSKAARTTEFSTIVYENQEKMDHEQMQIKPAQRLELYYGLYPIIILVPGVLFIIALFWMKKSKKNSSQNTSSSTPI